MPERKLTHLKIDSIAFGGDGVGRHGGKVVFVPLTLPGEEVVAEITKSGASFDRAELRKVVVPSEARTQPRCRYFGICGGCAYQHATYDKQLEIKRAQVRETLARLGGFDVFDVAEVIPAPAPYGYRNRITVHTQGGFTGFVSRTGSTIVEIDRCEIATEEVNARLAAMLNEIPPARRAGHMTLRAKKDARTFHQTNTAVGEILVRAVYDLVPPDLDLLIDAYCGTGAFAMACRDRARHVIGIDWSAHNIQAAQREAGHQGIEYLCEDVCVGLKRVVELRMMEQNLTAVILDPPREGLGPAVRAALRETPAKWLIYVSCNPATFARDAKDLGAIYHMQSVQPLDMFPQTAEIELVARFERRSV
jgi:23S rRNA (uracil1939-C5)-methyltransferase